MKTNVFPLVLRNLHYPAILVNVILMTSVLAIIRLPDITSGANILSLLADKVHLTPHFLRSFAYFFQRLAARG